MAFREYSDGQCKQDHKSD